MFRALALGISLWAVILNTLYLAKLEIDATNITRPVLFLGLSCLLLAYWILQKPQEEGR